MAKLRKNKSIIKRLKYEVIETAAMMKQKTNSSFVFCFIIPTSKSIGVSGPYETHVPKMKIILRDLKRLNVKSYFNLIEIDCVESSFLQISTKRNFWWKT